MKESRREEMPNKWTYKQVGEVCVVACDGTDDRRFCVYCEATARRLAADLNELERSKPMAAFAADLWAAVIEYIRDNGIEHEGTENFLHVAEKHGYATHELFNPVKHADIDGAEDMDEGDFVWRWTVMEKGGTDAP